MIDLDNFARQLSQRTNHAVEDWSEILNAAIHDPAFSQMTDGEIDKLIAAVTSPEQLSWLLDFFRDAYMKMNNVMPFDLILNAVHGSNYTLAEWLEVLRLVHADAAKSPGGIDLDHLVSLALPLAQADKKPKNTKALSEKLKAEIARRPSAPKLFLKK